MTSCSTYCAVDMLPCVGLVSTLALGAVTPALSPPLFGLGVTLGSFLVLVLGPLVSSALNLTLFWVDLGLEGLVLCYLYLELSPLVSWLSGARGRSSLIS